MPCLVRLASDLFRTDPHALDRVQLRCISRELEYRQPRASGDQLPHRAADVGGQVVPDQDDGPCQLLMGGVQQAGIVGLGEALAPVLAMPAGGVSAVDQPGPAAGPGADQRGHRQALATLRGHPHHRGMAAASPGAALRRPQALAGLVFEAQPGTQVRRRPFITSQVSCRHLAICASSRSAAWRAGICTLHPSRCSSTCIPASV